MLRRLLAVLAVLAAVPVGAGVVRSSTNVSGSGGGTFTGGTITTPLLAPAADNCASVPYSFTGDTNTGVCSSAADTVVVYTGGSRSLVCTAGNCEWYYSYTDASNYQRGALKTSATGIEIAAETAGSGADNLNVTITPAGTGELGLGGTARLLNNYLYSQIQALTTGDLYQLSSGAYLSEATSVYYWDPAIVAALGASLTGDVTVATLPAKIMVTNVLVVIATPAAGTTTLTVACGRTGAGYIDYIVASDAQAAANTVYGDASAERGTNLTGYDLPSYTTTTAVKCHFISTGANLSSVTGSVGYVYLTTRRLQ